MAIAEHEPGKLYKRNRSLLGLTHEQLHEFASTKRKGLPAHVKTKKMGAGEMLRGLKS